jgi:hypothetical protein
MLDHFFVSDCDGALHDTRDANWARKPLRPNYKRTYAEIRTVAEFKATLRAGRFAWPGGYPMYLICSDGAPLCFGCGESEARNVMSAIDRKDGSGWRVLVCDINYEDDDLRCEHCGEQIESAYGED